MPVTREAKTFLAGFLPLVLRRVKLFALAIREHGRCRIDGEPMPTDDAEALVAWGKRNIQGD
jgi:hypothetical protein